jgi:acetyltransferase
LPKCAIRPYPHKYIRPWTLKSGLDVTIRPIRPEDEPLMVQFHRNLSETSVYLRYFHLISLNARTAHERLTRICFIDYDREIALVAETTNEDGSPAIIGVARLSKNYTHSAGEVALMVDDAHQGQGLGTELMQRLVEIAQGEGLGHLQAMILQENQAMQQVCRKAAFTIQPLEPEVVLAQRDL